MRQAEHPAFDAAWGPTDPPVCAAVEAMSMIRTQRAA